MKNIKERFTWKIGEKNGDWLNVCIIDTNGVINKIWIYNVETNEEKVGWTTNLYSFLKKSVSSLSDFEKKKRVSRLSLKTTEKILQPIRKKEIRKPTLSETLELLNTPYLSTLSNIDYGKTVQKAAEDYVCLFVESNGDTIHLLDLERESNVLQEEYQYYNNGAGFDRLLVPQKKKIQIKFRQVDGKTPFSKQTHFSNTRRHSSKNKGKGDETGTISYSDKEMDYVLVILCHRKKNNSDNLNPKNWSFSLIPVQELVDVNRDGFLLNHIPSETLYKNKCDNIYMLTKKLEQI